MRVKTLGCILTVVFVLGSPILSLAGMESESYRITTSTMSGGGGPMGSANYQTNSTLGQSSPLMDPADPPYSTSYDLYPGFWHTVWLGYGCWFDLDGDGDVDGKDLAELAEGFGTEFDDSDLDFLVEEFGRANCPGP